MDPNTLLLPSTSNAGDVFMQKLAETKAAGLQKRADISGVSPTEQLQQEFLRDAQVKTDGELVHTYGAQLFGEYKQQQAAQQNLVETARRGRTSGELTKDVPLSLLSGGVNLTAGIPLAVADLASGDPGYAPVDSMGQAMENARLGFRKHVLLPGKELLGEFNTWRGEAASDVKQADQALMGQENAAVAAANQDIYDQAVADGDNKTLALLAREGKNAAHSFTNTFDHPTVLADTIVEQAPTFLIGGLAKGAVTAEQIAAGAAKKLGAREIGAETAKQTLLREATSKQVAEKLAKTNISKIVTATETGSNYGQAAGEIATMPWDELVARYPDAQVRKDAGESEDTIRDQLSSKVALVSAALTVPLAYGSSLLSRPFLAHPTGNGLATTLKKAGVNIAEQAGEASEEFLQGAGGVVAQNTAQLLAGDKTVKDILEGAGEAGGQGAAAALGAASAARAPGLALGAAVGTTKLAGKAAAGVAKAGFRAVGKIGATAEEELSEPVEGQKAAETTGRTEDAATLSAGFQAQQAPAEDGTPAAPSPAAAVATAPVESDPILTPKDVAGLKTNPNEALDTVTALSRAMNAYADDRVEDGSEEARNLSFFILKKSRELNQQLDTITDPVMRKAALGLLENEHVQALQEGARNAPPEAVEQMLNTIPEDVLPADAQPSPEVAQALAQFAELAATAPEQVSTKQTKRVLHHSKRMTPEQVSQVKLAQDLATVREGFTAGSEKIAKAYPTIKSSEAVGKNIFTEGFQLGKKVLPSLNDMAGSVVRALGNGHTQVAQQAITNMREFVENRIQRAKDFDQAARQHVENDSPKKQGVEVPNTRQLETATSLGKKAAFVNVTSEESQALIDTIHNEAQAAAGIFNTLIADHPELAQTKLTATAEASWKSMAKGDGVDVPGSAVASAPAPKAKTETPQETIERFRGKNIHELTKEQDQELAEAREALAKESPTVEAPAPKVEEVSKETTPTVVKTKTSSAINKLRNKVAMARNLPADASAEDKAEHIATMAQVEKRAASSLSNLDVKAHPEHAENLIKLRDSAQAAREALETSAVTEPANEVEAAPEAEPVEEQETAPAPEEVEEDEAPTAEVTENPKTTADRYPGPIQTLGEIPADATPVQKYLRTNKFLTAFKFNPKAQGLFARLKGGLEAVGKALQKAKTDPKALLEVYSEKHQHLPVEPEQVEAMTQIFAAYVPEIVETLNQSLYNSAMGLKPDGTRREKSGTDEVAKGFLHELVDQDAPNPKKPGEALGDKALWQYGNRLSLHVAEWGRDEKGKPYIRYQPEVAQAMALAVLNWGLATVNNPINVDWETLLKMYDGAIPANLNKAYQTSHFAVQPIATMAADLTRILGVRADSESSIWYTDGLPKALIHDALNALAQTGAVTLTNELGTEITNAEAAAKGAPPIYKTLPFITFNKSNDVNNWSTHSVRNLKSLRLALGNQALMTYLLTPDAQDLPTFGKPSKDVPTRMTGSGQLLSDQQRTQIKNENAVEFHANTPLWVFLDALGDQNYLDLTGYTDPELALNDQHRLRVEGKNQGLTSGIGNMREILELWQAEAENTGQNMRDIPAFQSHRMISNARAMVNGFSAQANKHAREMMSVVKDTLDLKNNVEHQLVFSVALAQALDIKTEKNKNVAAAAQIQLELQHPAFKQLFADMNQLGELQDEAQRDLAKNITMQLKAIENGEAGTRAIPMTNRAIHALYTQAQLIASENPEAFTTYLAVELDGKTDGPINAIYHFGLHTADLSKQIEQLKKGGWFLNEADPKVLADLGADAADLYTDVAEKLQDAINKALKKKTGIDRQMLMAGLHLLQRIGYLKFGSDGQVEVKRTMAKGGLVSMNYGAGEGSVNSALVSAILDYVHEEMSKSLRDGTPLDAKLQAAVRLLTGRYLNKKKGTWNQTTAAEVTNLGAYKAGIENTEFIKRMTDNLMVTAGGMLTDIIQSEMEPVMSTYQLLYKATALQTAQLRKAYNEAYDTKQAERVDAGELGYKEPLSKADEQAIMSSLAHLVPAYATLTSGGAAEEQGINVSTKDNKGGYAPDGEKQQVGSVFGGSRSDANITQITDPGVRAAPLLTIAAGDANMMTLLGQMVRKALNVFDGWEVMPSELKARALDANKASYDGWQFDLLSEVNKAFGNFDLNVSTLSHAALKDLAVALRIENAENMHDKEMVAYIEDDIHHTRKMLAKRAEMTEVNKQIFRQLQSWNDHMSTGENPYPNNGDVVANLPAYIASEQQRLLALRKAEPAAPVEATEATQDSEQPLPKNVSEVLASLSQSGLNTLDVNDVQLLIEHQGLQGKIRQFVYNQIKHLFPSNLQVHVGSAAEIAVKQQELFPGVDFGGASEVGASYENHIFIKNASEETLVHELVHAAVTGLLDRFYNHGMKGLTAHQRDAVRELEKLASEFAGMNDIENADVQQAQSVIEDLLYDGRTDDAVNEFLAWTLSNHEIQEALTKVGPLDTVKALAKRVLTLVRRGLGLPTNANMDTFLAQALGQFHRLTRRPALDPLNVSGTALFQSLASAAPQDANTARMTELGETIEWLRTHFVNDGTEHSNAFVRAKREGDKIIAGAKLADDVREKFEDAGFKFNDLQRHVFHQVQALMASGMQLDSITLEAIQNLYNEVMPQLTAEDFLFDPNDHSQIALSEATARFNALQGVGNLATDKADRSNLLANFMALGLVDESFREKLASLVPAKAVVDKSTIDKRIRTATSAAFDRLTDWAVGTHKAGNSRSVLDQLVHRLSQNQKATIKRQNAPDGPMAKAEQAVKNRMAAWGQRADAKLTSRLDNGQVGGVDGLVNGLLNGIRGITTKDGSDAFAEGLISFTNQLEKPNVLTKLLVEAIGRVKSNESIIVLLNKSRSMVSRVRQRLREEAPAQVRVLFKEPLGKELWSTLHKTVAKADLAHLVGKFTHTQLHGMLTDPAQRQSAIDAIESQFTAHADEYIQAAKDLGHFMVTGDNQSAGLLYSNAYAAARLPGSGMAVTAALAETMTPLLDQLASLRAMEALSEEERVATAQLLESDPAGMEKLLRLIKTLTKNEFTKDGAQDQFLNAKKGYVPVSLDPRSKLILASAAEAKNLVKMGYRYVAPYQGDMDDTRARGMAYYATNHIGGQAAYRQGAMQTVEGTVAGVDHLTGQSQDVALQTMITHPQTVARITADKNRGSGTGNRNLVPIFNPDGTVRAYQRTLDPAMIDIHLRGNTDLPQAIGSWLGRQAEEAIARQVNKEVVGAMHDQWMAEKQHKGNEFVDVSNLKSKVSQDTWNSIPRETQLLLKRTFDGPVMVRKDMLDNTLGYRAASIADAFTGMSDLPPEVQKAIRNAALGLMGKNAYRNLVAAERAIQGVVGVAKETIVVRSLTVGLNNLITNQYQLVMHGVPPHRMLQLQLAKSRELETYWRQEKRLTHITLELHSATRPDIRAKLLREQQLIHDANSRLSIWPLIQVGEVPSIAEDLSEHDQYTLMSDMAGWIEEKTKNIPPGAITAAKYAVIAKGTALHQGLNHGIQFGDFMAKAVLYDTMVSRGKSREEALRYVNDRFVNYNLLAGRTREYLESMGLTWFWNYKIRIQKIILATIRDNPLRFLIGNAAGYATGVDALGSDNVLNTNWSYSIGPGMLFHAPEMTMWHELMD